MVPGYSMPLPCGGHVVAAGRCREHYNDWRAAREARGIEARERRVQHQLEVDRGVKEPISKILTTKLDPKWRETYVPIGLRNREVRPIDHARSERAQAKRERKAAR